MFAQKYIDTVQQIPLKVVRTNIDEVLHLRFIRTENEGNHYVFKIPVDEQIATLLEVPTKALRRRLCITTLNIINTSTIRTNCSFTVDCDNEEIIFFTGYKSVITIKKFND